ncbi:MAG: PIN domain-containing protein [Actinomycetota bacterium]
MVDTQIVSYIFGERPEAESYAPHLEGQTAALSFQSLAELWFWPIKRKWGDVKKRRLDELFERFVILNPDEQMVRTWAELRAQAEAVGMSKQIADLWIAATAKRHSLPLLTNDRGFLTALDIDVVDVGTPKE